MASILIMEDDAEFAFGLRDLLEMEGHEVRWSRGATEALEVLKQTKIDLVITDIYIYHDGRIVRDGGISLIGGMRQIGSGIGYKSPRNTPVIAITAASSYPGNAHILDTAQSVGAQYALAKPFSDKELLDLVVEALGPS
ncbi:MAG: response regulator [Pseudomonadota bacterium]